MEYFLLHFKWFGFGSWIDRENEMFEETWSFAINEPFPSHTQKETKLIKQRKPKPLFRCACDFFSLFVAHQQLNHNQNQLSSRNHETRKQNKQKFQFGCCNASHHHRMAPHRERTILSVFQKTKVYVSTNSPTPTLIINEILWKIITKQLCQQNVNFQDGESFVGSDIASLSQNKNFCTSFEYLLIWHSLQLNSSFNSTHTRLWSSRKANIQL